MDGRVWLFWDAVALFVMLSLPFTDDNASIGFANDGTELSVHWITED